MTFFFKVALQIFWALPLDGFLNLLPEFWRSLLLCWLVIPWWFAGQNIPVETLIFMTLPGALVLVNTCNLSKCEISFVTECSSRVLNLKQLLTFATFPQMLIIMVGDEKQKTILQIFSLLPLLIHRKRASGISTALSKGSEALGPQCKILLMALSHWDHHRVWTTDCITDQNQIFNGPVRLLAMATKPNLAFSYSVVYLADNMRTVQSVELKATRLLTEEP